jgi:transcriptional regulator with XRE-family HTH domain
VTEIDPSTPDPSPHHLIRFLHDRRLLLRLSQKEVSDLIGVSQGMVSNWETGQHAPSLENLDGWARALGFRVRLVQANGRRSS